MLMPDPASILVVDNDLYTCKMFGIMLTRAGYDVTTAANGREALEQIAQTIPDLLVLDHMMPYLTGIEVLNHLVLDPQTASIPVLMISAAVTEMALALEPVTQQMKVTMLPKPVGLQQMLDNVAHLLGSVEEPQGLARQPQMSFVA